MHRVAALVETWHHRQRIADVARVIATAGSGHSTGTAGRING